jgi:predicted outer membrane repeat protein
VSDNSARTGAGIYNDSTGELTLQDLTLSNNTAVTFGGGLYNYGSATLYTVQITGNKATDPALGVGGGFYATTAATTYFSFCTLQGNSAPSGAGGFAFDNGNYSTADCNFYDPVVLV